MNLPPVAKGIIFTLTASLCWGLSGSFAKFLFTQQLEVLQVVQTRSTFAFALILIAALILRKKKSFSFGTPKKLGLFFLAGLIGIAGANYTYYYTIQLSTVATAIILQYMAPILVMIWGVVRKEELATKAKIMALIISLTGCFLSIGTGSVDFLSYGWLAIFIGILSAVTFAGMGILGRYMNEGPDADIWQNLIFTLGFAALFWAVIYEFPWNWSSWNLTWNEWGSLVVFSIVSVLIPYIFFYSGLKYLPPTTVLIISTFEPAAAIMSAWIFLGEDMSGWQVLGTVLVLSAILVLGIDSTLRRKRIGVSTDHSPSL